LDTVPYIWCSWLLHLMELKYFCSSLLLRAKQTPALDDQEMAILWAISYKCDPWTLDKETYMSRSWGVKLMFVRNVCSKMFPSLGLKSEYTGIEAVSVGACIYHSLTVFEDLCSLGTLTSDASGIRDSKWERLKLFKEIVPSSSCPDTMALQDRCLQLPTCYAKSRIDPKRSDSLDRTNCWPNLNFVFAAIVTFLRKLCVATFDEYYVYTTQIAWTYPKLGLGPVPVKIILRFWKEPPSPCKVSRRYLGLLCCICCYFFPIS
jgi:hypothetical protein